MKVAYSWLAKVYREGDQIYLFGASSLLFALADGDDMLAGFSQGAFQVRELASLIHEASTCTICSIDDD